jgi:PAP2 superfamily
MVPTAIGKPESSEPVATAVSAPPAAVHISLGICSLILLVFCLVAAPHGAFHFSIPRIETALLLTVPLLIPAALYHERKSWDRRDSALMLPWTLFIALLLAQVAPTATTHPFPLRDVLWRRADEFLGIRIPDIMAFTARHPFLDWLSRFSYARFLHPLLLGAIFLPALVGKKEVAQRFLLANAFAFVLAIPCMVMLPAVGPWVGWHFAPTHLQQACQASIESLRRGSIPNSDFFGGIICFPSFHVFWALVSAHALQPFRFLRYPAIVAAGLVVLSTMTTGWHYGIDVIGGILLAVISTLLAGWISALGNCATSPSEGLLKGRA